MALKTRTAVQCSRRGPGPDGMATFRCLGISGQEKGHKYDEDTESKESEAMGEALSMLHKRQPPRVRVRKGKGVLPCKT